MRRTHNLAQILPLAYPYRRAMNVYDEAAAGATDLDELDRIDIDNILLSSYGLDPALPWKEYGILNGNDAHRDRIPSSLLQEMDDQVHRMSLMMSAESRTLAEETDDPMWAELLHEALLDSLHSSNLGSPSYQPREHHHWQPARPLLFGLYLDRNNPSTFRLHLRADSRPH
eukprot:3935968-Rhodomonas_salina.1